MGDLLGQKLKQARNQLFFTENNSRDSAQIPEEPTETARAP